TEIAREEREKLFSPLGQNSMIQLGLSVSALILSDLNGKIRFLDGQNNGSGAKFLIELQSPQE
ncbi:MAG TPA: hypothetical protein P5239_11655, partial [Victivallales bacterium]|nr:hypothetical protein [Victivallales bacterium]